MSYPVIKDISIQTVDNAHPALVLLFEKNIEANYFDAHLDEHTAVLEYDKADTLQCTVRPMNSASIGRYTKYHRNDYRLVHIQNMKEIACGSYENGKFYHTEPRLINLVYIE